jgi:DNA-binding transcriptional MerR regulator
MTGHRPWRPWERPESLRAAIERPARTAEVADALGLRPCTVQAYARKGRVPSSVTPGGHHRFNLDEVRAALQEVPIVTAARQDFNREVARLAPEILRDPVAYAVVHMAEVVFGEYEQRLMQQARSQSQYSSPRHHARRGDDVEVWLKTWRDSYDESEPSWHALNTLLEDYRLHGDYGKPLDEEASER